MTIQIVEALEQAISPLGIAVRISATHGCMTTRGVHRSGCWTDTQILRGVFRNDAAAHAELVALLGAPFRP